jgi:antibiotic biosynthesis monooxygenase (ABM) superfamily enzyme
MIERFAFVKLAPEHATDAERRALVDQALATLRDLPGVLSMTVGLPADPDAAKAWDLCVNVRFASLEDAAAYRSHPVHRRFVDEVIAPRSAARKGWTFSVETR